MADDSFNSRSVSARGGVAASPPSLQALLQQRYADPTLRGTLDNAQLAGLLAHRSVRRYLPRPLPAGTLELMVAAAQSASSSSNLQVFSIVAVEDPERRRVLSQLAGDQAHIRTCSVFLAFIADLHRLQTLAERRAIEHAGLDYLELFLLASVDTSLAAQNAAVAAEALGLGVVFIGALRNQPERVAEVLGLPPRTFALFGMCVGWPDDEVEHAIKPRLAQRAVLHRETYDAAEAERAVDEYDAAMQQFYREQQIDVGDGWSRHSARRVSNAQALHGRDRLREALQQRGFLLR